MTEGRGKEYGVVHLVAEAVPEAAPTPLLAFLEQNSISTGELLLKLGAIYVNEVRAETNEIIRSRDYVRVHTQPRRYKKPTNLTSRILEQTSDYLMVDKPAGIPVHSQVDNSQENLLKFLEDDLHQPLFVTHRLDIETTGCLLIAKNLEARRSINQLFRDRQIKKHYVAVVERPVESRLYTHFMKPSFKSPREVSEIEQEGWLKCELRVLSCMKSTITEMQSKEVYEVEIELLTGRPQQIRAQLSALGAPIAGDSKYGSTIPLAEPHTIMLRCNELIFDRKLTNVSFEKSFDEPAD